MLSLFVRILLLFGLGCFNFAYAGFDLRVWQPTVPDYTAWTHLAKPMRTAEFSKFIIDVQTNKIYFVDAHVFALHVDFVLDVLLKQAHNRENIIAYNLNYEAVKPHFILGYLTHYPQEENAQHRWVFSFWEGDKITAPMVAQVASRLKESFFAPNVSFRPDSPEQELVAQQAAALGVPIVTNGELYKQSSFQAFNTGTATGRLKIVPATARYEDLDFQAEDIVILQESYPDITPVAGIITTRFSTPLAHVSLRATAWGIPNAVFPKAIEDFSALNGKIVTYRVTESGLSVRLARATERTRLAAKQKVKKKVTVPQADLHSRALLDIAWMQAADVQRYGTKAVNLGVILQAMRQRSRAATLQRVRIPTGFGVPFYYYVQHLHQYGLDAHLVALQKDPRYTDKVWRKQAFADFRAAIIAAPLAQTTRQLIVEKWQTQLAGKGVFVRSSTNAEDLRGFNGAGLYDTLPNITTEIALEAAVKQVWASLWNWRAVEERAHFGIADTQVYPAVLIQTAVPATAAGVLLTTDIWGHQPNNFTINAKWGLGMRVVEGQKMPEQVIYDTVNQGVRIISRADERSMLVFSAEGGVQEKAIPIGQPILTEARARKIGEAAQLVVAAFSADSALDIEWVLEGEKVWIVQARPYVVK